MNIMKKSDLCFVIAVIGGVSFALLKHWIFLLIFLGFGLGMIFFRKKDD